VLNALYSPLVGLDTEAGAHLVGDDDPNATAESIESDDNKVWTITLKEGWTMHNGEPLVAQNYVDAWNYGAYGPNATTGGYFFGLVGVEGNEDLLCPKTNEETGACIGKPKATEMSGLKVIDDRTFEVTLNAPFGIFPLVLNYSAFNPVPSDFLDDPKKYEDAPVGNGPFQMDGVWEHDQGIRVTRYPDWPGQGEGNADSIEYRIYSELDTGYNDLLAGNLDIMDSVPAAQLDAAQAEFGENFVYEGSAAIGYLGFPVFDPNFKDKRIRQAISMAIDREEISNTIRPDFRPLGGFVPEIVPGALNTNCDGHCEFNLEEAKRLYDEAGGIDGPMTIWFNSGADHEDWIEAVSNQLRQNLGIEEIKFRSLDFAEYLPLISEKKHDGPFRLGWVPDYPNPHTYLESIYGTDASSNYSGFSNKEFDELMSQAKSAESPEASIEFTQAAEKILNEEMPGAPIYTSSRTGAWSERVDNVVIDFFDNIEVVNVTVTE